MLRMRHIEGIRMIRPLLAGLALGAVTQAAVGASGVFSCDMEVFAVVQMEKNVSKVTKDQMDTRLKITFNDSFDFQGKEGCAFKVQDNLADNDPFELNDSVYLSQQTWSEQPWEKLCSLRLQVAEDAFALSSIDGFEGAPILIKLERVWKNDWQGFVSIGIGQTGFTGPLNCQYSGGY